MIGQSFSPMQDPNSQMQRPLAGDGGAASPLQNAIQVLQLRMPHFFGGTAPAPAPLLQSQGAPPGFNVMALLQRLMGGQMGGGGAQAPMVGAPGQAGPSLGGGMAPGGSQGPIGSLMPSISYLPPPPPGGTAGNGPFTPPPPQQIQGPQPRTFTMPERPGFGATSGNQPELGTRR